MVCLPAPQSLHNSISLGSEKLIDHLMSICLFLAPKASSLTRVLPDKKPAWTGMSRAVWSRLHKNTKRLLIGIIFAPVEPVINTTSRNNNNNTKLHEAPRRSGHISSRCLWLTPFANNQAKYESQLNSLKGNDLTLESWQPLCCRGLSSFREARESIRGIYSHRPVFSLRYRDNQIDDHSPRSAIYPSCHCHCNDIYLHDLINWEGPRELHFSEPAKHSIMMKIIILVSCVYLVDYNVRQSAQDRLGY